ncbi:G-box-binding factor 1 isoform X3 [Mercurialis annua]|uniref:G-box-binding factor 1 isoform X3 n=1 Tax=Mercurialis annua TaxID=3986 RepID=UPI00215E0451|nr:G-box-binding factor 1 isoform X3 [Mercurialis annua]
MAMKPGEESTPPKPSKPASSAQEIPTTPSYPDWQNSMQAYYGAGATPPPFFASTVPSPTPHPYLWGGQHHLMPPYGTPVPYPALYPAGGVYAHPSMAMAPNLVHANTEYEGKGADGRDKVSGKKSKGTSAGKTGETAKAASGSGNDGASPSAESGSDGSSDGSDDNANPQDFAGNKKGSFDQMLADAGASKIRPGAIGAPSAIMPEQWVQDERELKRQKRKQSNRESARRSRLRKQAECEELQARVETLNTDNRNLRDELQRISDQCDKLKSENESIKEELTRLYGPDAVANLEQNNHSSVVQSHDDEGNK